MSAPLGSDGCILGLMNFGDRQETIVYAARDLRRYQSAAAPNSVGKDSRTTSKGFDMSQTTKSPSLTSGSTDLLDEVRESAKVGQHAAAQALRRFSKTIDQAIPQALQPLRTQIIDAAIELADKLAAAQYQFNRNLIHSADRALSKSDDHQK
jgi:hypothetical protein